MGDDKPKWSRAVDAEPRIWLQDSGIVIRDVTPDLDKYVVDHMVEYFAKEGPLNQSTGLSDDPVSLGELEGLWRDIMLPQRVSLVALQEGTPGAALEKVGIANPPTVLGVNVLNVVSKGDNSDMQMKGEAFKKVLGFVDEFSELVDVYEKYGIDHYMNDLGLSVAPIARGRGIGILLLKGRFEVCRVLRIPLTKTVFSAIQSQKLAAKTGFQILAEKEYDQIKDASGHICFPNMAPHKTIQLCARTIP